MGNVKCFAVSPAKRKRLYHGIEECVKFFELFIYRTIGTILFIRLFREPARFHPETPKQNYPRRAGAFSESLVRLYGKTAIKGKAPESSR